MLRWVKLDRCDEKAFSQHLRFVLCLLGNIARLLFSSVRLPLQRRPSPPLACAASASYIHISHCRCKWKKYREKIPLHFPESIFLRVVALKAIFNLVPFFKKRVLLHIDVSRTGNFLINLFFFVTCFYKAVRMGCLRFDT